MTGNYKQNIIIEHKKKKKKNISIDSVFTPEINEVLARVKVHLEFCSRPIYLTPKSPFPKSGQYRTFLSQPGSGRLIRLAK